MNRDRQIALRGDGELRGENGGLVREVVAFDPAIESDLADAGVRMRVELRAKMIQPVRRAPRHIPRMQAERRQHPRLSRRQRGDRGPVVLPRSIHDGALQIQHRQNGSEMRREARVVEMIVGVDSLHLKSGEETEGCHAKAQRRKELRPRLRSSVR